ncbi:HAD family hydrolase [Oceanobacillus massiliensis]|uniref:HAD family hydrolase n=1 Tax=Oceanobacillus massiliensis TaxID=1465765 RepID=UPI00301A9467
MYRIVFLDIDGTILNSHGKLEDELIRTVEKVKQHDVIFGLATGRSLDGSIIYGEKLGCSWYVTYNGSLVLKHERIVHDVRIPAQTSYEICSKTKKNNGTYIHFSYRTSKSNKLAHREEHLLPYPPKSDVLDTNDAAHRLSIYVDAVHRAEIQAKNMNEYVFEERDRLEVYPKGSKWTGIQSVIDELGILPRDVITIGNGINDVEMLEAAGLGIVIGNATSSVRASAELVVQDNDHSGVAFALKRIFQL